MADPKALIEAIRNDAQSLIRARIELIKAQIKPKQKVAGVVGGSFGTAGYLALNAVSLLFLAGAAGFAALFSRFMNPYGAVALGLVAMAVVLLIIAAIAGFIGYKQLPKLREPITGVTDARQSIEAVKSGVERGQAMVASYDGPAPSPQLDSSGHAKPHGSGLGNPPHDPDEPDWSKKPDGTEMTGVGGDDEGAHPSR